VNTFRKYHSIAAEIEMNSEDAGIWTVRKFFEIKRSLSGKLLIVVPGNYNSNKKARSAENRVLKIAEGGPRPCDSLDRAYVAVVQQTSTMRRHEDEATGV
jgi:hypothetical protein